MPIRVGYEPVGAIAQAAYGAGLGRAREREQQQGLQLALAREQVRQFDERQDAIRSELEQRDTHFWANLDAQKEGQAAAREAQKWATEQTNARIEKLASEGKTFEAEQAKLRQKHDIDMITERATAQHTNLMKEMAAKAIGSPGAIVKRLNDYLETPGLAVTPTTQRMRRLVGEYAESQRKLASGEHELKDQRRIETAMFPELQEAVRDVRQAAPNDTEYIKQQAPAGQPPTDYRIVYTPKGQRNGVEWTQEAETRIEQANKVTLANQKAWNDQKLAVVKAEAVVQEKTRKDKAKAMADAEKLAAKNRRDDEKTVRTAQAKAVADADKANAEYFKTQRTYAMQLFNTTKEKVVTEEGYTKEIKWTLPESWAEARQTYPDAGAPVSGAELRDAFIESQIEQDFAFEGQAPVVPPPAPTPPPGGWTQKPYFRRGPTGGVPTNIEREARRVNVPPEKLQAIIEAAKRGDPDWQQMLRDNGVDWETF